MIMAPPPVDPLNVTRVMMATAVAVAAMTMISRMVVAPVAATLADRMTHAPAHAMSAMAMSGAVAPISPTPPVPLDVAHATIGMTGAGAAESPMRGAATAQREIHGHPHVMTGMRVRVVAPVDPHQRTPAVVADAQAQPLRNHAVAFGTTSQWQPDDVDLTRARPDLARSRRKRRRRQGLRLLVRR